jgi:hypothetical protein
MSGKGVAYFKLFWGYLIRENGLSQERSGLRRGSAADLLLGCGFGSRRRHGCLSRASVVCCQVEASTRG